MTFPAHTLSVSVDRPYDAVYSYAGNPLNLVHWASGLGSGFRPDGDEWVLRQGEGEVRMRWTPPNPFGVCDHDVVTANGTVHVAMRVMPNGEGAEVTFLLLQTPDLDDAAFARDRATVEADLARLKAILETPDTLA